MSLTSFTPKKRLFFLGFSLWKRHFMKPFFKQKGNDLIFLNSLKELEKYKVKRSDEFLIWGKKISKESINAAISKRLNQVKLSKFQFLKPLKTYIFLNSNHFFLATKAKISFVEDGFIRSVSLGSDLTRPYSLIVDKLSLYVDPSKASELENILEYTHFDKNLLQRARNLITTLTTHKISKYNALKHKTLEFKAKKGQKILLIPAQVEDDVSMQLGGFGLSTKDFIKQVRENNPNAYIVFKPHPDVLSGNRLGLKDESVILRYCDEILKDCSIDSAILASDEIHTITSTSGFDALLRGKKVFTYGLPFYAGWKLTNDLHTCQRRTRTLSLEELVAGVLILYPKYIHPKTKTLCEIEVSLDIMLQMQEEYFSNSWVKMRVDLRNFILRKIRRMIEKIV